jgi:hypothetical protein
MAAVWPGVHSGTYFELEVLFVVDHEELVNLSIYYLFVDILRLDDVVEPIDDLRRQLCHFGGRIG